MHEKENNIKNIPFSNPIWQKEKFSHGKKMFSHKKLFSNHKWQNYMFSHGNKKTISDIKKCYF